MLENKILKRDLENILKAPFSTYFKHLRSGTDIRCHLNVSTPIFFEDGMSGTAITVLFIKDQDIKLKDEILLNDEKYEITKIELESQVLKRAYLREIWWKYQ